MNAAPKKRSVGFEKTNMPVLRDGTNQMRDAGMKHRLASPNPNDRRAAADNCADLFVGNRMAGIGMQNFGRIDELDGAGSTRRTQFPPDAGQDEVRSQSQGKAHHAL